MTGARVVFASFIPPNPWTGMGRWTRQMTAALERAGYATRAWFDVDFPMVSRMGRLAVLVHPISLALRSARRRARIRALVVHEPSGFWYGLLRRAWRSLPPMVVMCHNVESRFHRDMRRYADDGLATAPSRLRAPLLRHWQSDGAIRRADHVLCLSREDRVYITEELGVPPDRVTQISNGVEPADFVTRERARTRKAVLWIGGWLDVKGRRVLPDLWRIVRRVVPDATLSLVGTGQAAGPVLDAFDPADRAAIRVEPSVHQRAEMQRLFAQHDLLLMTSLSEGAPLTVLEAMAAALPIVATRVGGVPDLVAHETEALLYDPRSPRAGADAVVTLLQDERRAASLAQAGCERARSYTWDGAAETLAAIIARLEGDPPR